MKSKQLKRKYAEIKKRALRGGVIDRGTFLARQSKGFYPAALTYEQFSDQENA